MIAGAACAIPSTIAFTLLTETSALSEHELVDGSVHIVSLASIVQQTPSWGPIRQECDTFHIRDE